LRIILEEGESLLGRSHLVVNRDNLYVEKHYFFQDSIEDVKFATRLMKIAQPDLFVSEETRADCYVVTQRHINHYPVNLKGYHENISNYLTLVESLGYDWSKRDLQHYNIIYQTGSNKPYLIDWDDYITLGSREAAYGWYKSELTGLKWLERYNITLQAANSIFEEEWKNV
jgi:hypothetical protein